MSVLGWFQLVDFSHYDSWFSCSFACLVNFGCLGAGYICIPINTPELCYGKQLFWNWSFWVLSLRSIMWDHSSMQSRGSYFLSLLFNILWITRFSTMADRSRHYSQPCEHWALFSSILADGYIPGPGQILHTSALISVEYWMDIFHSLQSLVFKRLSPLLYFVSCELQLSWSPHTLNSISSTQGSAVFYLDSPFLCMPWKLS